MNNAHSFMIVGRKTGNELKATLQLKNIICAELLQHAISRVCCFKGIT